jgi:signal transduction histidine kinase
MPVLKQSRAVGTAATLSGVGISFAVAMGILALIAIVNQLCTTQFLRASQTTSQAHKLQTELVGLFSTLQDAETGQRGYILTGNKQYLEPYLAARAKLDGEWTEIGELNAKTPDAAMDLQPLKPIVADLLADMQETIDERQRLGLPETSATVQKGRGERDMVEIRRMIQRQSARISEVIAQHTRMERQRARQVEAAFWTGGILSVGLLAMGFHRLRKEIAARQEAAAALRSLNDELEQRVQSRTGELSRANEALKASEDRFRKLNERLEVRVRERTTRLQAMNKGLEAFSYSVSHDLRSPIRTIGSFSEILMEDHSGRLDAEGRSMLNLIVKAAHNMDRMVNGLLDLSRLGRRRLTISTIDMTRLAQEVMKELLQQNPQRQVNVKINPLPPAQGNPATLRQVFQNLFANALKYTRNRAGPAIEVGAWSEDGTPVYFVKDNGAGFDMEQADKLFLPFQRLHGQDFEGTGIGLATVSRIIAVHGGRIWAEGKVDDGAIFSFTLRRQSG